MAVVMWVGALKAIFIFLFMNLFILHISYENVLLLLSDKNVLNEKGNEWLFIEWINKCCSEILCKLLQ